MDAVARWPARDRADLFREAGVARGMDEVIVEKDFWVCWTLKRLFADPGRYPGLVFKGGTSLSKGYSAIGRFSEDIDLSFDREKLGFSGDRDPDNASSGKQAERLIDELVKAAQSYIATEFLPSLEAAISAGLGARKQAWSLAIDEEDPQTVRFRYPASLARTAYSTASYVPPVVRLELGARGDPWPATRRVIRPYAAETRPEVFENPDCEVDVLAVERTFWEKATLLHAEHHRPPGKATPGRLSRHYYDIAMLARGGLALPALARTDLLDTVARHKALYFRAGWARYDLARPGTLRLSPTAERRGDLEADYAGMRSMFFEAPPSFTEVLAEVDALESRINGTPGAG